MSDPLERLKTALANRYTIEREIGSGGMATVYLAEDLRHHRQVALKVLRPELAAALGPERFLREIEIAAQLHHPHVLPLYDSGEADGFLYYVMPYAEGESLRDRLNREKQLAIDDALQIAREVADALSYAHGRGVIHRDIKPENILLESGHAVVADFGVARAIDAAGEERLTETGMAVGTPAYMSPEQAAGERELDGRSDLYSLGCVLHEMLAGQPPFTGPTVESLVHQHLSAEPPNVTAVRPSVPAWVVAALERSLAKTPADRFNPVAQFGEAISPRGLMTPPDTTSVARVVRRRWMMAGAAVGVAAVITVIAVMAAVPRTTGVALDPSRIVVAAFRNETGDPSLDLLGRQAGHWITQGLLQTGIVQVVPWETALQSSLYVQGEVEAGRVRDWIQALAEETAAGRVVSGAYYRRGEEIQYQLEVTDAANRKLLTALDPEVASLEAPDEAIERLRQQVMGFLAVSVDERIPTHASMTAQPPTYDAYRAFDTGMERYIRYDNQAALPYFYQAFEADTTFVSSVVYAALCHMNLAQWAQADSLLRILERHRERLSGYDQHWLAFLKAWLDGDFPGAHSAIRQAAELSPGSKAVFNRARAAFVALNRPQEAIDALLTLDPERGAMRGWRFYFTELIGAYLVTHQYEKALEAAQENRRIYGDDHSTLGHQALALAGLGRHEEADALIDEIAVLPDETLAPGSAIQRVAVYLLHNDHSDAAAVAIDKAIEWYDARPAELKQTEAWRIALARALYVARRCDEAYGLAQPVADELPENVQYRGLVGALAACRGDRDEALAISRWLQSFEGSGPFGKGSQTAWRALIAGALADGETAVQLWRQAVAQGYLYLRPWQWQWVAFEPIRDYPPFQELMRPKG